jgi:hypothetical protein
MLLHYLTQMLYIIIEAILIHPKKVGNVLIRKVIVKKAIVCTTINFPTEAIIRFSKLADWDLIIVGDLKTPHKSYDTIDCIYLTPIEQQRLYPLLSDVLGWNCVQRRNIGFIFAYDNGYEIIATVDDDNIPDKNWGSEILVGKNIQVDLFTTNDEVFDPFSPYMDKPLWHRGFPIQLLDSKNNISNSGKTTMNIMVQSHLVNGDPDIDAIARITLKPDVKLDSNIPYYTSNKIMPFNSQNTILHRNAIPYYFMFPFVGRMDDIWGSYILQYYIPNSVVFGRPQVHQIRNNHDLVRDLIDELHGYQNTLSLIRDLKNFPKYLPKESYNAFLIYQSMFKL